MCVVGAVTVRFVGLAGARWRGRARRPHRRRASRRSTRCCGWPTARCCRRRSTACSSPRTLLARAALRAPPSLGCAAAARRARRPRGAHARRGAAARPAAPADPAGVPRRAPRGGRAPSRRRWRSARSCWCIAPWTIRNLTKFEDPVLDLDELERRRSRAPTATRVYHGDSLGLWRFDCYGKAPNGDESEQAAEYRKPRARLRARPCRAAAGGDGRRASCACGTSTGRASRRRYEVLEGRSRWASRLGLLIYYPTLLLAVAGARGPAPAPRAAAGRCSPSR